MGFVELVRFAIGALRGHRLRTALSVAGVAVGIAAVVSLTALGEGARQYVVQEFSSLGTNLLIVIPGRVETTGMLPFGGTTNDLTLEDYRALASRIPLVVAAAPLATGTEVVRAAGRSRSVPIMGTTADLARVRRLEVASGRYLTPGDPDRGGSEVVLGSKVARELFGAASPLGQVVRIGDWRFRVVGVLAPRGHSLGFDFDDIVYVPVRTAMRMFNRASLFRILVEVRSERELRQGKQAVLDLLAARHRVEDVTVITQDAVVSTFNSVFDVLTLALVAIASVSLTVAGVGIMNVMLVAVAERRREIGLLKALGASTRQVLGVFIAEASVLSSLGGLIGLAAGWLAVRAFVQVYPTFPAAAPSWAVAASLAVAVGVGIVFGAVPARRAARLDPVQALVGR
ncbi:MAG: ABC transporter permease [Thermoanaerobaculales bacterium]|jgi:putative ABC transport system permease protein|nr:ABC transporter permease [Thermoanaerobaculales bacterium]